MTMMRSAVLGTIAAGWMGAAMLPVHAGSESGNFMVRVQGTVVDPDSSASVTAAGARIAGADAEVDTEVLPTATLTYFFNKNLAVELFCCFAKLEAEGKGAIAGTDLGDFWVFPPALTLQYHFDNMGAFKPYIGAGVQYIHFFGEGDSALGGKIDLDDAIGFTLQAGIDVSLGGGWYLNADVKKTFIETDATWKGTAIAANVEIDPWIYSVGVGYRFNIEDLFSRRDAAPLK